MKFFKKLPVTSAGASWEIRSKVVGIHDKGTGKGTVMERVHDLIDAQMNKVYTRSWENCYFIGSGGWGGERGE
jgi:peroxisomal enoyl-CoA hydratase 2